MTLQAKQVNLDTYLTLQDHRIGRYANAAALTFQRDALPDNSLERNTKQTQAGAYSFPASISGDTSLATDLEVLEMLRAAEGTYGLYQKVVGNTAGTRGHLGECRPVNHRLEDPVHALSTFSAELVWKGHVALGYLLANYMKGGALTATANGTAIQLPAVAADEEVVAGVVEPDWPGSSGTGRTLDVKTQSATDEAFTVPVDRHTFTQITTTSASEFATPIAGALASLWWRVVFTVAGTPPIAYYPMILIGIRKITA